MTEYDGDGSELDGKLPHHNNAKNSGIDRIYGINPLSPPPNVHHGYKLWINSPDGWVGMTTGDGVDQYLRSLNVWDGHQWLQVCCGAGVLPSKLRRFNVKVPRLTVDFTAATTNPMFEDWHGGTASADAAFRAEWAPLLWVKPRVDPTWRIVSLCGLYPIRPQINRNDYPNFYSFYPCGGLATWYHTQNLYTGVVQDRSAIGTLTRHPFASVGLCSFTSTAYDQSLQDNAPTVLGQGPTQYVNSSTASSSVIDFKTIRRKLQEYFPTCDPYYNGSYDDIVLQNLKRVYMVLDITFKITIRGPSVPARMGENIRARLYMNTNVPVQHASDDNMPVDYGDNTYNNVDAPLTNVPSGTVLFDHTGVFQTATPNGITNYVSTDGVLHGQLFEFQPGENNMQFTCVIDNLPAVNAAQNNIVFDFDVTASQINLHYATPPGDTPANTHDHYVTTYDVA